jgi:hypothetical protein
MIGATISLPDEQEAAARERCPAPTEQVPAWDLESSPRLYATDLADPESFHRRLIEWLMNQK